MISPEGRKYVAGSPSPPEAVEVLRKRAIAPPTESRAFTGDLGETGPGIKAKSLETRMEIGNRRNPNLRVLLSLGRVGAPLLLALGLVASCSGDGPGKCDFGACDGVVDGMAPDGTTPDTSIPDAKPDVDPIPTDCTTPTDPVKNPEKCLVDSFAVFVSPTGDDTKDGSKTTPFKTIAKALSTSRSRIVVCEGEYASSVDVTRAVEVYGGVSCDFTKAGARFKVVASKAAYAIKVSAAPVVLADVEVVGLNGATPGESSVAVLVADSTNTSIRRSKLEAGEGASAAPKQDGLFTFPASAPNGGDAAGGTGGVAGKNEACPGGGKANGGLGGNSGFDGENADPIPPGGAKGTVVECSSGMNGRAGAGGVPGANMTGAIKLGTLGAVGFNGAPGTSGGNGTNGGGGGGSGGFMGAGGGGGAGGCGGQGGLGGGPGGSSIALASVSSDVTVEASELIAKNAKPGGAGGAGQAGQMGGFSGNKTGGACGGRQRS